MPRISPDGNHTASIRGHRYILPRFSRSLLSPRHAGVWPERDVLSNSDANTVDAQRAFFRNGFQKNPAQGIGWGVTRIRKQKIGWCETMDGIFVQADGSVGTDGRLAQKRQSQQSLRLPRRRSLIASGNAQPVGPRHHHVRHRGYRAGRRIKIQPERQWLVIIQHRPKGQPIAGIRIAKSRLTNLIIQGGGWRHDLCRQRLSEDRRVIDVGHIDGQRPSDRIKI